jgi:hypothetical protein
MGTVEANYKKETAKHDKEMSEMRDLVFKLKAESGATLRRIAQYRTRFDAVLSLVRVRGCIVILTGSFRMRAARLVDSAPSSWISLISLMLTVLFDGL